jgi:hypothetical protein
MCRSAVRLEKQSNFKMVSMALAALLTVIGTHKPASTHAPTCTRARNGSTKALTHTRAHECMQPPAQVVTLAFVCAAALIDRSTVQAERDPPVPLTFACGRRVGVGANRWLPCGAAPALHDGAHQGFDGSAERLCKHHGRSSVRHEVPA